MKRYRGIFIGILMFAVLASGCGKKQSDVLSQEDTTKPIAVDVIYSSRATVDSVVTLTGKALPIKDINVLSKIPGRVSSVNVEVGRKVQKGDVLFLLEDNDARLQLKQAESALIAAKAGLNRATGGVMEQQLIQLESAMILAETNYNDAKINYERTLQLFEMGAVSKQILEVAESRLIMLKEQYESAKSVFELTKTKINPESIVSAEAQVAQAQAAYDMVKSQLDNTVVRAPFSGMIASKNISVGEFISSAVPAIRIVDISFVEVNVNVTEHIINKIRLGDRVPVSVNAVGQDMFEGQIISVSPVTDPKTQTYPIRIRIANNSGTLKAGMFCEVKYTTDKVENALVVPISCVIAEEGESFVYVVNDDSVSKRHITLGLSNDKIVEVVDGLHEGETVIIKGQTFIQEGSKVTIIQ